MNFIFFKLSFSFFKLNFSFFKLRAKRCSYQLKTNKQYLLTSMAGYNSSSHHSLRPYLLVCNDLRWPVLTYDDPYWPTMTYDLRWPVLTYDDPYWPTMRLVKGEETSQRSMEDWRHPQHRTHSAGAPDTRSGDTRQSTGSDVGTDTVVTTAWLDMALYQALDLPLFMALASSCKCMSRFFSIVKGHRDDRFKNG